MKVSTEYPAQQMEKAHTMEHYHEIPEHQGRNILKAFSEGAKQRKKIKPTKQGHRKRIWITMPLEQLQTPNTTRMPPKF